jgi:hypothetical protein
VGRLSKTGIQSKQLFASVILCSFRQQFYFPDAGNDLNSLLLIDEKFALGAD